jgi:predicted nucleic acid-binding protein
MGMAGYGHRRDAHHNEVKGLLETCVSNHTLVHTSDYVLDELITLLFRRESYDEAVRFLDGLLADSARGTLQIQRLTTERFQAALELRKRFRDKLAHNAAKYPVSRSKGSAAKYTEL